MKVKLIKVYTNSEHVSWNYGDDYADVMRHVVGENSGWTDVDNNERYQLGEFIRGTNEKLKKNGYYYLLIDEEQPYSVQIALTEMVEKEEIAREKAKQEQKAYEERQQKIKEQAALKKKERLEKQLAKLQKELDA